MYEIFFIWRPSNYSASGLAALCTALHNWPVGRMLCMPALKQCAVQLKFALSIFSMGCRAWMYLFKVIFSPE